jgi:hypothetical protein
LVAAHAFFALAPKRARAVVNPFPDFSDASSVEAAIDGLPGRTLARQVRPLATSAADVKDDVF